MVTWKTTTEYQPEARDLAGFVAAHGLALPSDPSEPAAPLLAIEQPAWEAIWAHARSADVEVGGLLVGEVYQDAGDGRPLTVIRGAIPALGGASSPVSFTFTPDAWDYLTTERDRSWPDLITVGWFHTHPGLGVFYSSTDRATQAAHFNRPWNVGIVVDPLACSDAVALFTGADSRRVAADTLMTLPAADAVVPVPAAASLPTPATTPAPVTTPTPVDRLPGAPRGIWRWSPRQVGRVRWDDHRPKITAAAAGAALGVAVALWLDARRREG